MADIMSAFGAVKTAKWIPKLWGRLGQIRQAREKELDEINKIMFGDPVELARYYVEPDCQEMNPADRPEEDRMVAKQPVMVKIDEFLEQPSFHQGNNQLFILSDAGMGKSALLTMLKLMHMTRFWPNDRNCVLKKLGPGTLEEIKTITNQRKTVLLLDSLDEDPRAYGRVEERLLDILDVTRHFFKTILTCRTQFFPKTSHNPLEMPGQVAIGGYSCYSKYLSFFNDEKVMQYLNKRFPKKFGFIPNRKHIDEAQKIIDMMGSLRCRPMLLCYIEDLMKSPRMKTDGNEYRIYTILVESWIRREKLKIKDISEKDIYDACIILATWMQTGQKRKIDEVELDRLIEKISTVKAITKIELKGRSLLNRNSDGDYRFSHYSIQEFCVCRFLLEKPLFLPKTKIPLTEKIKGMIEHSGALVRQLDVIDIKAGELKYKNSLEMEFVYIPPGTFMMGCPENESGRSEAELLHDVTLTRGFYMQTTPVTQRQWEKVMGSNPSEFKNCPDCPVECVSWEDTQDYIKKLNELDQDKVYRLPTEAEWEYACRGGTQTKYYTGDAEEALARAGWYDANSDEKTHPVGQKEANGWGLYDMHGNVWEWCQDWYENYPSGPVIDPAGPESGSYRVLRGGSWVDTAGYCRAAYRSWLDPGYRFRSFGFRLALVSRSL